ncbi:MAG: bifunctional alpha,alpha-trehalose-phosphate synthase (UDP-forming)/trehalose-phosphatase [Myxococcota bacterium]|nr:bifunctional alpha,alpha-trehalose-phosphate synthase (UDP-forming)/trehalose-phosphatase [Myxococcota bacterium]
MIDLDQEPQHGTQNKELGERPIVIASNRLPFTLKRGSDGALASRPSAGGLVAALEPVLRRRGGTWVGWPGIEISEGVELPGPELPYRVRPVALADEEVQGYYDGFSNGTIWPLFHSMPQRARFEPDDFAAYVAVNEKFATAIASEQDKAELVWIHDYHLMVAGEPLRQLVPDAHLAFFLHIPFPPYDLFRLLPWDRELLRGMLACDLIGFHVEGYAANFLDCVERLLGARVDREALVVHHGDRAVQIDVFPIGIDFSDFESRAAAAPMLPETERERIVLGVDRLDYTKGIPERIRAFERLLELHPEHQGNVALIQLAVPSRGEVHEYQALKREIDELVGQVNGRFSTARWSPIRYLHRSVPKDRLAGLYRDADVAIVTPLRDGMNLVAKEYVASQVADPGVLILSKLAGAAETMREALVVNPYHLDEVAATIHTSLEMDADGRRERMEALRQRERREDVHDWVQSFLQAGTRDPAPAAPLTDDDAERWLGAFLRRRNRLALFLDYDGTLAALREHPGEAVMEPGMRAAFDGCVGHPNVDVTIVSGRALSDVRAMVGSDGVTFAGNHGLEIAGPDIPAFKHEDLVHYEQRIDALASELEAIASDGAWTEAKGPTLTFHVRRVPLERRRGLLEEARRRITAAGFQARDAHAALEGRPPIGWDKGRAVLHVLRARYGPGWSERVRVVYVGDDQTDEDAFRFLQGLARTFRVGSADTPTDARHRLSDTQAVNALIDWIARRPVSP